MGLFDVILELVGAPNLPGDLEALALWGRVMVIGIGAGAKAELNLGLAMQRGLDSNPDAPPPPARGEAPYRTGDGALVLPNCSRPCGARADCHHISARGGGLADGHFAAGGKLGKIAITMGG